ncbi:MAG: glycoside hydrolase family 3 C-terminal domain-containing protein [Lachnospiraceae bacterium]|nr:glycoside hydrolase family 3 C-terminal domain-containing protein [Lachnospiraceae bacterium]MCM1240287.1 glycoside hydrolase family 3 C-terminal domain-containing protein [Lachnospiraceae bacterium]
MIRQHTKYFRDNGAECTVLLNKDGNFPLDCAGEIAVYGSGARHTLKGGTGSGEVNMPFVTVEEGLKNAGFSITSYEWLDAYDSLLEKAEEEFLAAIKKEARQKRMMAVQMAMGRSMEEPEYEFPLNGEGSTAIYVLSRISGEGSDRKPVPGDILLTETEVRDILACNERYENFMLVLNTGGMVDLSPVAGVKNILLLSQLGAETGNILADILLGYSGPSGKLTATWYAWKDHPKIGEFGGKDDTAYWEGIYVGYRYFDTLGIEPLFPFGHGLSWTEFRMEQAGFALDGETVSVSVDVTNIGKYPGKQVLQLYVSVPDGRLDQPYQALAGFAKTAELCPGETQRVTVSYAISDLASYDLETESYILEAGNYIHRIGADSRHTTVAGIICNDREIVCGQFARAFGDPGFRDFVPEANAQTKTADNVTVLRLSADGVTVRKPHVHATEIDEAVSRMTEDQLIKMNLGAFDPKGGIQSIIGNAAFTVAGAAGQTFMQGGSFGIPSAVMADGTGGLRISREYVRDAEGNAHAIGVALPESQLKLMPRIIVWFMKSLGYHPKKTDTVLSQPTTAIPIGTAVAQSFSAEFAEGCGDIVAAEMAQYGVHLWLAPSMNIQRDARCGRNFEYYSEDPVLSGEIAAAVIRGIQKHPGCGATIKHFACNNQELNRTQNNSQVSERALRDIYLKGFAIAVRKGNPMAVMTSYNLINGIHTAEHRGLIENYLREEAGFQGIVMSDWVIADYATEKGCKWPIATAVGAVMAGGNLFMPGSPYDYKGIAEALKAGKVTREQLMINASETVAVIRMLTTGK